MRLGAVLAVVLLLVGGGLTAYRSMRVERPDETPAERTSGAERGAESERVAPAPEAPDVHNVLRGRVSGIPEAVAAWGRVVASGGSVPEIRVPLDAAGRFTVWNVPAGQPFGLRVEFGGISTTVLAKGLVLADGQEMKQEFSLAEMLFVAGRVTDRDGRPVPGTEIAVVRAGVDWSDRGILPAARTDADGRYVLMWSDPRDMRTLKAVADRVARGFVLEEVSFEAPRRGVFNVDFTLEKGLRIAGRVVDAKDRPIAGAVVEISEHYYDPEVEDRLECWGRVKTDADGRFSDDAYRAGRYRILVRGKCDGTAMLLVEEDVAAGRVDLVLRFRGFGSLALRFEDGSTGRPVPVMNGCLERVYDAGGDQEGYIEWATFGNEEVVSLERVPAGDYRVRLNHRGFQTVEGDVFRVDPGRKHGPLTYRLHPTSARER